MRRADRAKAQEQRAWYRFEMQDELIASGVVERDGSGYVFSRDHPFDSPSTAAEVVLGTATNGWIKWISENGASLADLAGRSGTRY
jgi:hypothetical protein